MSRKRRLWLFSSVQHAVRVLDRDGVVRLQKEATGAIVTTRRNLAEDLDGLIEGNTEYGTIGGQLPALYAYYGEKQLDMSGLVSREQIDSVLAMELDGWPENEPIVVLAVKI